MKRNQLLVLLSCLLIVSLIAEFIIMKNFSKSEAINNEEAIKEINRLLLPIDAQNVTENDFDKLRELVKDDEYASDEVRELTLLTKYKEYTHIGHGLGFLYDYIKYGKKPICPGHSLSHYYVFLNHGEKEIAEDNLEDAKENFDKWKSIEESRNQTYLAEIKYTSYVNLINTKLSDIEKGNNNFTQEDIDSLSEAPCTSA